MSEDAHEIEWSWKNHINQFYLDELRKCFERAPEQYRKELYGEWESDERRAIPNPAYYELEWYPFVGWIGGYEVFDITKPRLTAEQYKEQQMRLNV